jgi:hypothetical protein
MKKCYAITIVALILNGCGVIGPAALPPRTEKKVTKADIVGIWKYDADYKETLVTLELKPDGTFIQTIIHSDTSTPQVHKGTWDLEETTTILKVLKPAEEGSKKPWVSADANWWIMDSVINKDTKFSICGTADDSDPDNCGEMKKIR